MEALKYHLSLIGYIYRHTFARAILPCMLFESVVVKLLLVVLVELVVKVLDNRISFFTNMRSIPAHTFGRLTLGRTTEWRAEGASLVLLVSPPG